MTTFLSVFLGGGLGSILRHLVCSKIGNHWAVMSVNLMGAMLIGIAFEYFAKQSRFASGSARFCHYRNAWRFYHFFYLYARFR